LKRRWRLQETADDQGCRRPRPQKRPRVRQHAVSFGCATLDECCAARGVVEICGVSGAAKTELLMHAALSWALPVAHGGAESQVVYIDYDFRLCPPRLRAVAEARCTPTCADATATRISPYDSASLVDATLARIAVVRCETLVELVAALEIIERAAEASRAGTQPAWAADASGAAPERLDGGGRVLVVLDSIGDMWRDEKAGNSLMPAAARAVSRVVSACRAPLLCAKPSLFQGSQDKRGGEYMPPQWVKLVQHRLYISESVSESVSESAHFEARPKPESAPFFSFAVGQEGCTAFVQHAG